MVALTGKLPFTPSLFCPRFYISIIDTFCFTRSVKHETSKNINPDLSSPYIICEEYQRFVSTLAINSESPPTTRISADGRFITFHDSTLDIENFRSGLKALLLEAIKEIDILCCGLDSELVIPSAVPDDWRNDKRGYSWVSHVQQLQTSITATSLVQKIFENPSNQVLSLNKSGKKAITNPAAIMRYMKSCKSINQKLALLCYFLPGPSQRISQFIEHKYANSTRPRTLFRDMKDLWLVIRRSKSDKGKDIFSPLKLPPILTKLLEKYLLIVRPFEMVMASLQNRNTSLPLYQEYLWVQDYKVLGFEDMRSSIKSFFSQYCQVSNMGPQRYRQICVEIGRVYIGSENGMERTNILDAQMCHSSSIANNEYAVEFNRLPGMPSEMLLRYGRTSEQWWEVIGMVPDKPPMLPLAQRLQAERDSSNNFLKIIKEQIEVQGRELLEVKETIERIERLLK